MENLDSKRVLDAIGDMMPAGLVMPERLYHYTTFDVWQALASGNADLCCTDFHELNDSREYNYGFNCMAEVFARDSGNDKNLASQLQRLKNTVLGLGCLYAYSPWVFSLSKERDSLHQWVSYTDKIDGGVAIGLAADKLLNHLNSRGCPTLSKCRSYLVPCLYAKGGRFTLDGRDIDLVGLFERLVDGVGGYENVDGFRDVLLLLASMIKDSSFSVEQEWRVVLQFEELDMSARADVVGGKLRVPFVLRSTPEMYALIGEVVTAPHTVLHLARRYLMLPRIKNPLWKYKQGHSRISFRV